MNCFSGLRLFFLNGLVLPTGIISQAPEGGSLKVDSPAEVPPPPVKSSAGVFCEQLINSAIIAGIAAISTLVATGEGETTGKAAGIAFGLTFLIELRKWRNL
jgi:hypothetical protein